MKTHVKELLNYNFMTRFKAYTKQFSSSKNTICVYSLYQFYSCTKPQCQIRMSLFMCKQSM